ncbi:MAG: 3-dehydroquinate synthase [Prevotella sp.]|nr:3-dehydroquinate synthase [Prevotella sp.]
MDPIFILTDTNTLRCCWPLLSTEPAYADAHVITIPASDEAKNLNTLTYVWQQLQEHGATRHSMLVNLGGGMVTDLGGFAAATFKRGMRFKNIPTTLLAMVDAAIGGKTGINFGGLKNEIGAFAEPVETIIDTRMLRTLDSRNLLSGYAEMIKHALLASSALLADILTFDIINPDYERLDTMIRQSADVKKHIVEQDPLEKNLRKALNLGHTIGHAIESLSMKRGHVMLHGYAVAHGLVAALYMSAVAKGFPTETMRQVVTYIREHYGRPAITCDDYPELLQLMQHDKKNTADGINFTLLAGIGQPLINQQESDETILEALDFLREG